MVIVGASLDRVPFSGIIRIRDMMYSVPNPFRLDQGDVSFDVPATAKAAMTRAIEENQTHYLQTTGIPRLRNLIAARLRERNGIVEADPEHILVANGGIHALYCVCQAILEPGDEVIIPDPAWPPAAGNIVAAGGVPVGCPLHESIGWRYDFDELERLITPRTRVLYVNSPNNPTGGVLTRGDLERIAAIARAHDLWIIADEAYEDVVFDGEHVTMASLPGLYDRTISLHTFSKTYAMTGLRLGYVAIQNPVLRERAKKVLFYSTSNVASVVQYGGIGALEGSQACVDEFRQELRERRDLFYNAVAGASSGVFSGRPPAGAFYAFLRIDRRLADQLCPPSGEPSLSWRVAEYMIKSARIGCVPGVDFGANGEGYLRFCFARSRAELTGALESMKALLAGKPAS